MWYRMVSQKSPSSASALSDGSRPALAVEPSCLHAESSLGGVEPRHSGPVPAMTRVPACRDSGATADYMVSIVWSTVSWSSA